jgi:hypothetical protein
MNAGTLRELVPAFAVQLALNACSGPRSLPSDCQTTWDAVIIGDSSLWDVGPEPARLMSNSAAAV